MSAEELLDIEKKIIPILKIENARDCEKKLIVLLQTKFDLIKLLVKNRFVIFYMTKLLQA